MDSCRGPGSSEEGDRNVAYSRCSKARQGGSLIVPWDSGLVILSKSVLVAGLCRRDLAFSCGSRPCQRGSRAIKRRRETHPQPCLIATQVGHAGRRCDAGNRKVGPGQLGISRPAVGGAGVRRKEACDGCLSGCCCGAQHAAHTGMNSTWASLGRWSGLGGETGWEHGMPKGTLDLQALLPGNGVRGDDEKPAGSRRRRDPSRSMNLAQPRTWLTVRPSLRSRCS